MTAAQRNWGARLHEVTLRGVPAVVLENELLRVTVLLHGGHVVEFNHKPRDLDLVWLTPGGCGRPATRPSTSTPIRAGGRRWCPTAVRRPGIAGPRSASTVRWPVCRGAVAAGGPYPWPRVPAPDGTSTDLSVIPSPGAPSDVVYLTGFTEGWYELRRPGGGPAVRVCWDAAVLPYLWLWHEFGDTTGYPWWGRPTSSAWNRSPAIPRTAFRRRSPTARHWRSARTEGRSCRGRSR